MAKSVTEVLVDAIVQVGATLDDVKELVAEGADLNATVERPYWRTPLTPLQHAVSVGDMEVIKYLVEECNDDIMKITKDDLWHAYHNMYGGMSEMYGEVGYGDTEEECEETQRTLEEASKAYHELESYVKNKKGLVLTRVLVDTITERPHSLDDVKKIIADGAKLDATVQYQTIDTTDEIALRIAPYWAKQHTPLQCAVSVGDIDTVKHLIEECNENVMNVTDSDLKEAYYNMYGGTYDMYCECGYDTDELSNELQAYTELETYIKSMQSKHST